MTSFACCLVLLVIAKFFLHSSFYFRSDSLLFVVHCVLYQFWNKRYARSEVCSSIAAHCDLYHPCLRGGKCTDVVESVVPFPSLFLSLFIRSYYLWWSGWPSVIYNTNSADCYVVRGRWDGRPCGTNCYKSLPSSPL